MTRAKENWSAWKKILDYTSTDFDLEKAHEVVQQAGFYQNTSSNSQRYSKCPHYLLKSASGQLVVVKDLNEAEKIFGLPINSLRKAIYNGCYSYRNVEIEMSNLPETNLEKLTVHQLKSFFDSPKQAIPLKVTNKDGTVTYYKSMKDAAEHLKISTNLVKKLIEDQISYEGKEFEQINLVN